MTFNIALPIPLLLLLVFSLSLIDPVSLEETSTSKPLSPSSATIKNLSSILPAPPIEPSHPLGSIKLGLAAAFFFGVLIACGFPIVIIDCLQQQQSNQDAHTSCAGRIRRRRQTGECDLYDPVCEAQRSHVRERESVEIAPIHSQRWPMDPSTSTLGHGDVEGMAVEETAMQSPYQSPSSTHVAVTSEEENRDLLTGVPLAAGTTGSWAQSRRVTGWNGADTASRGTHRTGSGLVRHSSDRPARTQYRLRLWFSRCNCFAAGIFLSSGFMELYGDVEEAIEEAKTQLNITSDFPLAPFLTLIGFFLVLSIEQIVWTCRSSRAHTGETNERTNDSPRHSNHHHHHHHHHSHHHHRPPTPQPFDSPDAQGHQPIGTGSTILAGDFPFPPIDAALDSAEPMGSRALNGEESVTNTQTQVKFTYPAEDLDQNGIAPTSRHSFTHTDGYQHHRREHHNHHDEVFEAETMDSFSSVLRVMLLLIAMSVHSLFEGLAVGLQSSVQPMLALFSAILLHKLIIAAGIGVNLATVMARGGSGNDPSTDGVVASTNPSPIMCCGMTRRSIGQQCISTLILASSSPLGVLIGWTLMQQRQTGALQMTTATLQGLACGTFFFVVFCELLPEEFREGVGDRIAKLLFLISGFLVVALYAFLVPH